MLAVCFVVAQLLPSAMAFAAGSSDYVVICTADGFKKVPLAELGLQDLGGETQSNVPSQQECPVCLLICANGVSELAPHGTIVWAPTREETEPVLDDRPTGLDFQLVKSDAPPRAPPYLI